MRWAVDYSDASIGLATVSLSVGDGSDRLTPPRGGCLQHISTLYAFRAKHLDLLRSSDAAVAGRDLGEDGPGLDVDHAGGSWPVVILTCSRKSTSPRSPPQLEEQPNHHNAHKRFRKP